MNILGTLYLWALFLVLVGALLAWWLLRPTPPVPLPGPATQVVFATGPYPYEELTMLTIRATDKPRTLRLAFKDAEGNLASIDGVPVWAPVDPSVGTLSVAEDGLTAEFDPGSPSSGQIAVTCDADLGEGVKTITGVLDVVVLPGEATVVEISVDPASEN